MKRLLLVGLLTCLPFCVGQSSQNSDINTELMQTTFRIQGQAAGGPSMGTGFLVGVPFANDPARVYPVLITAAHVLNDMTGDSVVLVMRRKLAPSGWQEVPFPIQLRSAGRTLWVRHPTADVAALYVSLPKDLVGAVVPTSLLATDKSLTDYEIHPGDELNVLGYPLGFENLGGFPVLRSGKIASYPLVPTKENPFFLLDFRIFKGNSGGPVYWAQTTRWFGGSLRGGSMQMIMGLVSEEVVVTEQTQALYENRSQVYPLGLAKIVPATYILETIDRLPQPPSN